MKAPELSCRANRRRDEVRRQHGNGIDFVEVLDANQQTLLCVHFLGKMPEGLERANVVIEGGRRIRNIRVVAIQLKLAADYDQDDCLQVLVDQPGDFSTYTLRLVALDSGQATARPFPGIDARYAAATFSFKAGCPSDLDCLPSDDCPPPALPQPEISYLAKDYGSFRQLLLDRLALIMPEWKERHAPDLGITLVEMLAYVGDQLSYYQDAVGTEAYLDTARQRISVRRHARLVDYRMHEGCNARTWVCLEVSEPLTLPAKEVLFLAGLEPSQNTPGRPLTLDQLAEIPPESRSSVEFFEPIALEGASELQFRPEHNRIRLYAWGDQECCLPRGACHATLEDAWVNPPASDPAQNPEKPGKGEFATSETPTPSAGPNSLPARRRLQLTVGDVLIFEEVKGPITGQAADADPARRWAVRLTRVEPGIDPLYNIPVVEIEWAAEDALPFPFCLSARLPAPDCRTIGDITVVRGNVVLVDHGRTVEPPEPLGEVPVEQITGECACDGSVIEVTREPGRFEPVIDATPLTFRVPCLPDAQTPAARALIQEPRAAVPQMQLVSRAAAAQATDADSAWEPRFDLLTSRASDRHFVVEMDNEGRAHLRFGDGELGWQPAAGERFTVTYRLGNGPAGNVGAEAIATLVLRHTVLSGITVRPRNPLAARGGTPAESLADVRLFAPGAYRKELQRAITADDYAQLAERNAQMQRAGAELRWTGSWYEARVAVDPVGREWLPRRLQNEVAHDLHPFRRIGHDLAVRPARYVPLAIGLFVCVQPHHLKGHVEAALLEALSNRRLPDGRLGFFHPDLLTFGTGISLSRLITTVQTVAGVESVRVTRLQRWGEEANHELELGLLPIGPLEIARLDNDPSFPEHGTLTLELGGGR